MVQVSGSKLSFVTRIKVTANPNKMILDSAQTNLYVSEDNSDLVDVISTSTNQVVSSISVAGPKDAVGSSLVTYHGFAPNGLTLSPDGKTLYVTVGGTNSLAVADLTQTPNAVVGLVPTGYYPNDVSVSHDGKMLYVVNAKSVTGPDPDYFPKNTPAENASNQYIEKDEKSSLLSFPVPNSSTLAKLTGQVAKNNNFEDHLGNVEQFNRIVWEGLKGSAPYPTQRTGLDLRQNRQQLLLRTATVANAGS